MTELPEVLSRGERARLFPVLADTSKEGRSLSIFLACLANVEEFGRTMLSAVGVRTGTRTKIDAFTEVVLQKGGEKASRPDGLIVVRSGRSEWMALIEAKVGNSDLTAEQIEAYIDVAKLNGVGTVITISNQFAPLPTHHPVAVSGAARRKIDLFHWSWMFVLTQASLLLSNGEVASNDQRMILGEMERFLKHPSAGVRSFDQMPAPWTNLVSAVQAGGAISQNSTDAKEVIGAWHQEVRDLNLILTRELARDVTTRIPRAHAQDPATRMKADVATLSKERRLAATLVVPDAASPIDICADLQMRSISVSMRLRAPTDRKSTNARVNWLLRQVQRATSGNIHVRLVWPGRGGYTQHPLSVLRENVEIAAAERTGLVPSSFEILMVKDLGGRFGQRRNFISELEAAVPEFYEQIGQHLKAWQAPAPRLREERSQTEPDAVDIVHDGVTQEAAAAEG